MKKIVVSFFWILFLNSTLQAQSWNLSGNSTSSTAKLGTTSNEDLTMMTNNLTRLSLKKTGFLGLNTIEPRGWQEIVYCPPLGIPQTGFIVTKFACNVGGGGVIDINLPDLIGMGLGYVGGSGGEGSPTFTLPFSFLTGNITNTINPIYNTEAPLLWLRTEEVVASMGGAISSNFDTKMIVMPDGSVGINIAQPRAALDVRGSQSPDRPAAIFSSRALGTGGNTGPGGLFQYYTQQLHIVPVLNSKGYNRISKANDQGLFFSDGKGTDGANLNGALVFAPWSNNNDVNVGGMRMDAFGNVEFHGTIRATKVNVNAKWWSDFVFTSEYKIMSLYELEKYIHSNKHLPNIPSEKQVVENGLDVSDMLALHMQKIEELTLYIIALQKEIDKLKNEK